MCETNEEQLKMDGFVCVCVGVVSHSKYIVCANVKKILVYI